MDFIKKSIGVKISILFLLAFVVLGVCNYFFGYIVSEYSVSVLGQDFGGAAFLMAFFVFAVLMVFFGISKPISKVLKEIKALITGRPYKKIFTKRIDEVGILAHFFNDVTKNIERISVDIAEGKRMSKELHVGSEIQRRIIPKEIPVIPGLKMFGNMRPASEVGGDSFDIVVTPSGNVYVYVGDVTGHGVPAALIMMMVNTLIRTLSESFTNGYDIVVNTNRILKQRIEPRRFMTCVLLRWNSVEQKLYYTGAGHEHILVYRASSGICEVKQTGGIALGMVPDISKIIKEEAIPFEKGDFVVLYSDGIIEAKNIEGQMFGLDRLKEAVEQYASTGTPEELFANITKDFGIFVGEQFQEDDITLIAVQKT